MKAPSVIPSQSRRSHEHYRVAAHLFRNSALLGLIATVPVDAIAEGFRNSPAGSFNLGRAGGRFAHVDDSSAIAQNPANLVDLERIEAQLTPSAVYLKVDYSGDGGLSAETKDPWKFLPNLFVAAPFDDNRFAAGLGITTPYGLGNEWDQSGRFADPTGWRYQTPYSSELMTINLNPTFAIKLGEHFQAGVGLDVFWSELTFKQYYPWFLVTGNLADGEGKAEASGDGVGFGANLGITWKPADRHRFALTFRSPVAVDYEGDFETENAPALFGGGTYGSSFDSRIEFPMIIGGGYGFDVTDKVRLEVDFEWVQFSRFDSLPVTVGEPLPGLPSEVREEWDNTFTAGIGGDWRFATNWVLRAGYQFYESPVPDQTISPSIPDANQNVITVGLGYRYKRHAFEIAYGYDFYDRRDISNNLNPAFNGTYDITVHLFSAAYRLSF